MCSRTAQHKPYPLSIYGVLEPPLPPLARTSAVCYAVSTEHAPWAATKSMYPAAYCHRPYVQAALTGHYVQAGLTGPHLSFCSFVGPSSARMRVISL
jgi:hypothetical protein